MIAVSTLAWVAMLERKAMDAAALLRRRFQQPEQLSELRVMEASVVAFSPRRCYTAKNVSTSVL